MGDTALRRALRPAARSVRKAQALYRNALLRAGGRAPSGEVRVAYGHTSIPESNDAALGGIVKLQSLRQVFPPSRRFNVLYLVTSNLPHEAVSLARAARQTGARVVVNQNGVAYHAWFGPGWERINEPMAQLLQLADHVFYQSTFCKMSADRFLGEPVGPSEVLYNAVEAALQVVARVAATRPDVRLLISGELRWGPTGIESRSIVTSRAQQLGVLERVELLGPYSQAEAPGIFQRADLLLHTKYNDPCPAVVLEAMASGLPVVFSASGGVPELVGADAGIGIPADLDWERDRPPDPSAMAAAVLRVAENREALSSAARQRAVAKFDVRPWLDRHQQVLESLVK